MEALTMLGFAGVLRHGAGLPCWHHVLIDGMRPVPRAAAWLVGEARHTVRQADDRGTGERKAAGWRTRPQGMQACRAVP